MPVFNEGQTLLSILRRVLAVPVDKEIVIVDDGSTDGTPQILRGLQRHSLSVLFHTIRTALPHTGGKYVIIQDADLEYDPMDYLNLLHVAEDGNAVVYGSRNLQRGTAHRYTLYRIGGICLSALANALYGLRLSDETTCHKLFRRDTILCGSDCQGRETKDLASAQSGIEGGGANAGSLTDCAQAGSGSYP